MRVLCLDVEGGYGGSSRSLYFSLKHLDRSATKPEVWCRRAGSIQQMYDDLGVTSKVTPGLANAVPLERPIHSMLDLIRARSKIFRSRGFFARMVARVNDEFDVVHFNHSGLVHIAEWLRRRTTVPITMHYRRLTPNNYAGRSHVRSIARSVDHVVFITENEKKNFEELGGDIPGSVIYNIIEPPDFGVVRHQDIPEDKRLKVISLSNFALTRGTDQVVDVAASIPDDLRDRFLFVMAGDMALSRSFGGDLGRLARQGSTLADYVVERGLDDMFLFLGHVAQPEQVLAAGDVLLKPTRIDIPWGRDLLEAMSFGIPVITCGSWDQFIRNRETGFLLKRFDPKVLADILIELLEKPSLRREIGVAANHRVSGLCGGYERAADLNSVWRAVADR